MNIQKFLDTKQGKFIGRVYILFILFLGNALVPIGAVSTFINGGSPFLLYTGIAVTLIAIGILSTPYDLDTFKEKEDEEK